MLMEWFWQWEAKTLTEDHMLLPVVVTQASVLNVTGSKSAVGTDQKY